MQKSYIVVFVLLSYISLINPTLGCVEMWDCAESTSNALGLELDSTFSLLPAEQAPLWLNPHSNLTRRPQRDLFLCCKLHYSHDKNEQHGSAFIDAGASSATKNQLNDCEETLKTKLGVAVHTYDGLATECVTLSLASRKVPADEEGAFRALIAC